MAFPERSEEDIGLHNAILPRLLAGESPAQLAREHNCEVNKLRNWKSRGLKKQKKLETQLVTHGLDTVEQTPSQATDSVESEPTQADAIQTDNVASEFLRSFLGDQAIETMRSIALLRPEIPQVLSDLNKLITSSIEGLHAVLESGESTKTTTFQGAITHCLAPLTVNDRATIASAIKTLRHEFACLNNLPSEPLKIATLEVQTKQLAAAQHLHLHSHGSRKITPQPVQLAVAQSEEQPPAIDVTPEPVGPDLEDWQQELIRT